MFNGIENRKKGYDQTPIVSEEVYSKIKEAIAQQGYDFVVSLEAISVAEIMEQDSQREANGEPRILEAVDPSETMRQNTPPAIEIAINLKETPIQRSHSLHTEDHVRIISEEEVKLKASLSDNIRDFVSVGMPTVSMVLQLDTAYRKKTGEPLFKDWFARADDQLADGLARVGRYEPSEGMRVRGRDGRPANDVYAMAVVFLPRRPQIS